VGAGINFGTFFGNPLVILGLTLGLMLLKGVILFAIALVFRLKGRDKWLFTLSLAQAGEFGFVLSPSGCSKRSSRSGSARSCSWSSRCRCC
jgi:CPA2 family monovalent cation:H+ antiporter-2